VILVGLHVQQLLYFHGVLYDFVGICVIDLDTVMAGYFISDLGKTHKFTTSKHY
jgi:hypothetical protein